MNGCLWVQVLEGHDRVVLVDDLVGRLPLAAVSADEIDRVLGCVLTYSDENFNRALSIGFASSIRKEWAWRRKRGESLANLRAFAQFADPGPGETGPVPGG